MSVASIGGTRPIWLWWLRLVMHSSYFLSINPSIRGNLETVQMKKTHPHYQWPGHSHPCRDRTMEMCEIGTVTLGEG